MTDERKIIELCSKSFLMFATKAFNIVNPGQNHIPTLAFLAISHKLAEVASGHTRRLIINVPPRSGKSVLASIALPAFVLGTDPTRRVICASYSAELAGKLARDCRSVLEHTSYRRIFPDTVLAGKRTETEIETSQMGFRYATSVGGTLTGRGGNLIVIDDPMKPTDATSVAARERVWDWFTGTVGSRLDNKAEDAIVVVMQRLHVDDLSGRLLANGGWDVLSIPAIAERDQHLMIGKDRTRLRRAGEVLDPEREPRAVLDQVRSEVGSATFEAQYQQQPVPQQGGLIKWEWFKTYTGRPQSGPNDHIVISWDTAMKAGDGSDYSVGILAIKTFDNKVFILDVIREREDFPTLRRRIEETAKKYRASITLIEEAGSGISLLQDLRNKFSMIGIKPVGDKLVRFNTITPMIESGNVHLPQHAPWLEVFKRELLTFPKSTNDDQVDAFSQLLNWVRSQGYYQAIGLQSRYSAR